MQDTCGARAGSKRGVSQPDRAAHQSTSTRSAPRTRRGRRRTGLGERPGAADAVNRDSRRRHTQSERVPDQERREHQGRGRLGQPQPAGIVATPPRVHRRGATAGTRRTPRHPPRARRAARPEAPASRAGTAPAGQHLRGRREHRARQTGDVWIVIRGATGPPGARGPDDDRVAHPSVRGQPGFAGRRRAQYGRERHPQMPAHPSYQPP